MNDGNFALGIAGILFLIALTIAIIGGSYVLFKLSRWLYKKDKKYLIGFWLTISVFLMYIPLMFLLHLPILSIDITMSWFLIPFLILALVYLYMSHRGRKEESVIKLYATRYYCVSECYE